ncbi:Zn-dependent hydrolase [Peribacillus huizhouensis]|uniref:N-carbamoyl-L-amino-acid hydrolase n=1 Tax=Peribacillus huizhouensis TaxID=1501239 RepID=A0ABR6CVB8_9BACI|nr:Zn-dependent hydrolase [Peribacillus huizhouensis]MBA9028969.1 N-carbamoyl-L-amino-acid hydrolase [Peribacillus huizhouensis]
MELINKDRLWKTINDLADITIENQPWTRRSFTAKYNQGREWLMSEMSEIGLEVKKDEGANVIGRLIGTEPNLPPIVIGSHTDTVPNGGRFDGIAGVLVGLEIVKSLVEHNIAIKHTIEIVDFTAEEPSEYGLSTVGSRAWSGNLTKEMLTYTNSDGQSLSAAITFAGGDPNNLFKCKKEKGTIALYLELHIEQGPVLLRNNANLGVVAGIVGIQRYKISVDGLPNHAGTTPMDMRNDALTAAAEMTLALEKAANGEFEQPVVGTVGVFNNFPNASNVVPGKVEFAVEIRSISEEVIEKVANDFLENVDSIAGDRNVNVQIENISRSSSIVVNDEIKQLLQNSCRKVTDSVIELPSGAGHDANQMSLLAPVGMIFIPCKDGRSHCPEEWAEKEDLYLGAKAMLNAVLEFSK